MKKIKDLTGETFGRWTVLSRGHDRYTKRGDRLIVWVCMCACGTTRDVLSRSLTTGTSKSCGCGITHKKGRDNSTFLDRTGFRYGRLLVVGYNEAMTKERGRAFWDCRCDCGNTYVTSGDHLTDGHVQSCGCLQSEVARETNKGALSPNWNGGVTLFRRTVRNLPEYTSWRTSIFLRDNRICQKVGCGLKKRNIQAHHIIPLYMILEANTLTTSEGAIACKELWDISNGITLCQECHTKLHKIFGKRGYDIEQAKRWIFEEEQV